MESLDDDAGPATIASRRASAREKDIGQAEDGNATGSTLQEPTEARSSCRTPAMSEENFDGVPSPSAQDVNTSTEAILDMIDEFVDGPGAPKRVSLAASNDHLKSEIEIMDDRVIALESPKNVPEEDPPPPTIASQATSAKSESKPQVSGVVAIHTEELSNSNILSVVNTDGVNLPQECSSVSVSDPMPEPTVSENRLSPHMETQASNDGPPFNIPSSSILETVQNTSDISESVRQVRTVKSVTSSDIWNDVTIESAESTSSDISLCEEKVVVEQSTRSPLRRRLVRPGPSDRRPDSTVSSTVDIHTEQTTSDTLTKDVSSSSDAVPLVHGNVKPEEIRNISEISICKAETSMSPPKKIKLVRQKICSPLSNRDNSQEKSEVSLDQDQCQSTSTDSSPQSITESSSILSSYSSCKPVVEENIDSNNDSAVKETHSDSLPAASTMEIIPTSQVPSLSTQHDSAITAQEIGESSVEPISHQKCEIETSIIKEEENKIVAPIKLDLPTAKSSETSDSVADINNKQSSSSTIEETADNVPESPKSVPKLTIKIGNKSSEEMKSPVPKLTIKPIKPPSGETHFPDGIEQIPNVTKLNIKPILKPTEKTSEHSNDIKAVSSGQIPCVTKINIKPIPRPPEKVNDIHRKSSSSEISESEYSENDESTSTSDQSSLDIVPKVTIKLGKPGTQSEGKFYTEQPNIPKLTIKGLQHNEKEESESKLTLVISQPEEKYSEKIPKLTIKTVTKCENQPLSPKLIKKSIKTLDGVTKDYNIENSETQQIPKLKITTECYTSSTEYKDIHVPKITIKPVTKSDLDSKTNKKAGVICDSPEHIPLVTKLNIKPIVKPTESAETSEVLEEKVPVVSKLNIKPIVKPKDNELDSSIEDVPKITKLNIKPIKNPEEDSLEEKDCDEVNADIEENSIPVVSKINIKPIIKPPKDTLKDSENQSSETGNSSDDNGDHIPIVTKLNIKPIVKPNELAESSKYKVVNEESTPIVTKLNIKPIIRPDESKSPASPKKDNLKFADRGSIPVVTKLNIKPIINPNESESNKVNDLAEKSVKNPPLLMKINIKAVAETSTENAINTNKKLNNIDHEHLDNNIDNETPKIKLNIKPILKPETEKISDDKITIESSYDNIVAKGEVSSTEEKNSQRHLLQSEEIKVNCVSDVIEDDMRNIPTSSKDLLKVEKADTSVSLIKSTDKLCSTSDFPKSKIVTVMDKTRSENIDKITSCNENYISPSVTKSISNEISSATTLEISSINKINMQVTSVKNCTLLKKLLENTETKNEKIESQKISSNSSPITEIVKDSLECKQFDSGHSSSEKVNDIGHREGVRSRSPSPDQVDDVPSTTTKVRSIQDFCKDASETVTKPLEINVSEKITTQSSGQDSPRIILKINKTDHGASAKIITENVITNDSIQQSSEIISQKINNKPSPKKIGINSKRKRDSGSTPTVTMGKRLRSSRIVDSGEKPIVKRIIGKRPPSTGTTPIQNKESELTVLATKRLKLGQLLSNKSLTITPVKTKTSPDKPPDSKQGTKILNHTLVNNENCSKNGNSKLHSILSNLQSKQLQVVPLNALNCSDKMKTIPQEVESNTSTGSSDVTENCHINVQEMIINENSDFRDFSIGPDEISQDPLEVETPKTHPGSVEESASIPKFIESTPQPKKRGRPRKLPVSEGAVPVSVPVALPTPALEERPQRSLRLSRERPAILTKPRGGRGRGRGRGRGGVVVVSSVIVPTPVEPRPEEPVTHEEEAPAPARTPDPLDIKQEPVDPTSSRIKLPRMTEALDRLPGGSTPLSSRVDADVAQVVFESPQMEEGEGRSRGKWRGRGRGRTPGRSPRRGRGRGGGRGAMYMKETLGIYGRVCGPATTTVHLFEEETCMMDDNATPAKPTHLLDEDSQSSVKSSTNESSKMKKSKFADLFDSNKVWTAADVREYIWPPADKPDEESQVTMIQEQVAMFLGVKGFKRRYPELKRRAVCGPERDYVLAQGIVTEALCDLGITAVDASVVLDIMLSDYPHKYEEYRAHQRTRQLAAAQEEVPVKLEPKPEPKHEAPKADPEKTRQDLAAAAIASAAEWNARISALRRPACADLQSLCVHTRRPPRAAPARPHLRPPAGYYPHALLPGQYQHAYRLYSAAQLRYFPVNTVMAAPPPPPLSSESDSDSDHSRSSTGSDRLPSKRKRLTKVKRHSQTDGGKDRDRDRDRDKDREEREREREREERDEDTCRVCKLRLEANRRHTHERFLVCANCNCKLHPGCTELGADTIRKCREYAWRCAACKVCAGCGLADRLVCCGLCDRGAHPLCVGQPAAPPGRWHCEECAVCKSCGARDPSGLRDPSTPGGASSLTPGTSGLSPGTSGLTPGASGLTPGTSGPAPADWHHQTRRGPGGHKVYSHSLCTPCARAYRIGRYCPLCERSFIGPKGTMQLVICKLCDRQLHQECVRQTVSTLNVLDYTCGECRRGGITSRAAAVRLAPRTIATLFMAKRRFNKYAHRQYMQSRLRKPDATDAPDAHDAADAADAPDATDGSDAD